jgi:hypothetical protein
MMKKWILFTAAALLASLANASLIAWTTSDVTSSNDVVTTGTTIEAVNASGNTFATSNPTVSVNGIDFTSTGALLNRTYEVDVFATDTGDAGYNSLVSSVDYGTLTSVTINLTVVKDRDYLLQVWYADDSGYALPRTMTLTGSGTDNVLNGNDYAVGTFTADSTSQDLVITSSQTGVRLTAYQLRDVTVVPEPATIGMLGLGALITLLIRRHTRS